MCFKAFSTSGLTVGFNWTVCQVLLHRIRAATGLLSHHPHHGLQPGARHPHQVQFSKGTTLIIDSNLVPATLIRYITLIMYSSLEPVALSGTVQPRVPISS